MNSISWPVVITVSASLCLFYAIALILARHLKPQPFKKPVTPEPSDPLDFDISDDLSPHPFSVDDKCGECGGYQPVGYAKRHCYICGAGLPGAVVDAGPNTDEAA